MVTEQIANLSTGNCRQGSSPCLSAFYFLGAIVQINAQSANRKYGKIFLRGVA